MKSASINELKATLKTKHPAQLAELCLRLARAKKENKELLTYLLYEADDLPAYLSAVKKELDETLADMNTGNLHWIKKSLRKMIRFINKHVRFTGSKAAEAELRIHFCMLLKESKIPLSKGGHFFSRSTALANLYDSQLKKAETALKNMHEDLQRDYYLQLDSLKR